MTPDNLQELKDELTDTARRLAELYSRCIPYTNDDLLEQHIGNAIESVGKSVEVPAPQSNKTHQIGHHK